MFSLCQAESGLPTDTIVPDPNPCTAAGCANYRVTPKAYGIKAFDLGSHGDVEPVVIANPRKINLTAYAVGAAHDFYITIINKTHSTTHDAMDAAVVIEAGGFNGASVDAMVLTDGEPGNAALPAATLGGATVSNDAPWSGKWTPLGRVRNGKFALTVASTTAVIVRIRAAGRKTTAQPHPILLMVFTKSRTARPQWMGLKER